MHTMQETEQQNSTTEIWQSKNVCHCSQQSVQSVLLEHIRTMGGSQKQEGQGNENKQEQNQSTQVYLVACIQE